MPTDTTDNPASRPPWPLAPAEPLFAPLIPGLQHLADAYRVSLDEVDDEILQLFLAQLHQVVPALSQAVVARDEPMIRQAAHSLQGMGGTIGVPELSVVGMELSAAACRADFPRCQALLQALLHWLRQTNPGPAPQEGT
jgi:HPt (histidine-containing phosphotransfer) domain-containing protein